ncbi:iron ABC transporter permease [Williamsia sp. D3]|nr:iron ABC transporter permease [Williamsia sp. D3]
MPTARPAHSAIAGRVAVTALGAAPLVFVAVMFGWPLVALAERAFADGSASNLWQLLDGANAAHLLWFTVAQAAASTALTLLIGLPLAWVLSTYELRGALLLRVLVTIPFVSPTVVVGIAFSALLGDRGPLAGLDLAASVWAILLAHTFFNVAVVVRTVGSVWSGIDPRSEQAARTLGAGPVRVFRTITLPALAPAIASAASVVFLFCATSFGVILILGGGRFNTLETEIYRQAIGFFQLPAAVALSMVQIVVVAVVVALSAILGRRVRATAAPRYRRRPRGREWPVIGSILGVSGVILLAPPAILVLRSVRPTVGGGWNLDGYRALSESVNGQTPLDTMRYSLVSATWATVIAMLLGLAGAVAMSRARGWSGSAATVITMLPLGVSAVTVGLGYLVVLTAMPREVSTSPAIVPAVQALIACPLVIRILVPAMGLIDRRLRQATATLGAGPWRVWWTVDFPVIRRALCAAAGFAFVIALGEFGATSFVARPDTTTVPVLIGSSLARPGSGNFATAMACSVMMLVVTAVVVTLIEVVRREERGGEF